MTTHEAYVADLQDESSAVVADIAEAWGWETAEDARILGAEAECERVRIDIDDGYVTVDCAQENQ